MRAAFFFLFFFLPMRRYKEKLPSLFLGLSYLCKPPVYGMKKKMKLPSL